MNWYLTALKKYAIFSGRASRKEYWMFTLIHFIISTVLIMLHFISEYTDELKGIALLLVMIYGLVLLLPCYAVLVRRLHDTGRSGYAVLLLFIPLVGPIVLLVFICKKGTEGDNIYGADPLLAPDVN